MPRENQKVLQAELDAIEWKIQTTSLDLQEEKGLIRQVKELETLLSSYKKIDKQNKKIKELIIQRKAIEEQADVFHKELTEAAQKSQAIHSQMIEKVNAAKVARSQADALHQAYIQGKEDNVLLIVKMAELTGQIRGLRNSMREEDKVRRAAAQVAYKEREQAYKERERTDKERQQVAKEREQAIKQKIGAEAKEKLQKGEKVSWDEFQLSMSDEDEDADKSQD